MNTLFSVRSQPKFGAVYPNLSLSSQLSASIPEPGDLIVTDKAIWTANIANNQNEDEARETGVKYDFELSLTDAPARRGNPVHDAIRLILGKADRIGFRRASNRGIEALTTEDLDSAISAAQANKNNLHLWA